MKTEETKLNPYKILWTAFVPEFGVVTVKDQQKLGGIRDRGAKVYFRHHGSESILNARLERIVGKLGKPYKVYIFTDKQFGMIKESELFLDVLTEKQKEEAFYIN